MKMLALEKLQQQNRIGQKLQKRTTEALYRRMLAILLSRPTIEYLEMKLFLLALMLRKMLDRMQIAQKSLQENRLMLQRKLKDRAKITLSEQRLSRSRLGLKMQKELFLTTLAMRLIEQRLPNSRKLRADQMPMKQLNLY